MNRKVENIVGHFNTRVREDYWSKVSDFKKEQFIEFLEDAKNRLIDKSGEYTNEGVCLVETDESGISERAKPYFRGLVGYSIFGISGIKSGIYTEDSMTSEKTTDDHLLGAMKIGETAFIAYCKSGFNNEYMKNVWLYENLYLWLSIKVSSEEHRKDNILRNKNTIEEKLQLKHYIKVSDRLFDLKEIVYYKIDIEKAKTVTAVARKTDLNQKRIDFLSSISGDTVVRDNDNKNILKGFLDKGLVVKYSEYV